ncbi:hypothetical protein TURU_166208 [Turdus rufiventris]|nr:hypothetical protein TURU_166208 [Turdus rufiventris]
MKGPSLETQMVDDETETTSEELPPHLREEPPEGDRIIDYLTLILEGCYKIPQRLNNPNSLSLSSQEKCSNPFDHLSCPPLDLLQQIYALLMLEALELDAVLQERSHQSGLEKQNHCSQPAVHTAFGAVQDMVCFLGYRSTLPGHIDFSFTSPP